MELEGSAIPHTFVFEDEAAAVCKHGFNLTKGGRRAIIVLGVALQLYSFTVFGNELFSYFFF